MTGLAWTLLGAAVLLVPGVPDRRPSSAARAPDAADRMPDTDAVDDRPRRPAAARALAAGAVGLACIALAGTRVGLILAAVLAPAAGYAVRRLQVRPVEPEPDRALPLVLDLAAAALRSGRPLTEALALAAPAAGPRACAALRRVAALARLGADPEQAWSGVAREGPLGELARVAVRSAASGLRLAAGFERLAGDLRAERAAAAAARAHRAGVAAMAPLAACFLPSFVCLGVIPVVVGVARSAFALGP